MNAMNAGTYQRVSLSRVEELRGSLSGGPWPDQDPPRDFREDPSPAELVALERQEARRAAVGGMTGTGIPAGVMFETPRVAA